MTEKKDPYTFTEVKEKKDYFVKLTYFDKLVDKCFDDVKTSALSTGKWSDDWENDIKNNCKNKISAFMFVEIIKEKHSVLYRKAIEEAKL